MKVYEDGNRHYHNLRHIASALTWVDHLMRLERVHDPAVPMAAWFHDVIYEPLRQDNEELSADFAARMLSAMGATPEFIAEVRVLVLATKHHEPAAGSPAALLCDADLAILGSSAEEYQQYAEAIRREYSAVPDPDFWRGRLGVLENLLSRPTIFSTHTMREEMEEKARDNLRAESSRLRSLLENKPEHRT